MDTLAIIKRIELRIAELGMSKADFYKNSGISSASYSQWNTGKYKPTDTKLQKAAETLGVSFEYLRYGENKKAPTETGERSVSDADLKFALWGDCEDVDDDDLADVRRYAAFVRERKKDRK